MAKIEVRVFASLRQMVSLDLAPAPDQPFFVNLEEGAALDDLRSILGLPEGVAMIVLVNGVRHSADYVLREGDRVGLFPPVGGG